jgi:hypothetical protein
MNDPRPPVAAVVDALIERSSLGEPAVKKLRARTPPELARQIVVLSQMGRGVSGRGDIGVIKTEPPERKP